MEQDNKSKTQRGLEVMEAVYGAEIAQGAARDLAKPLVAETVEHLFADIWSRSELSVRDRRLLVLGATATMGRPDIVTIQAHGALLNSELTVAQLEEIPLMMAFYAGWGNAGPLQAGIEAAIAKFEARAADTD